MGQEEIISTQDANAIADDLINLMSKSGSELNADMATSISGAIDAYMAQVKRVEEELSLLVSQQTRKSALEKMKTAKGLKKEFKGKQITSQQQNQLDAATLAYQIAKQEIQESIKSSQIQNKVTDLYTAGYKMVMNIRQKYMGQEIEYNVAVEGASSSLIYKISEEQLLKDLDFDLDRFTKLLIMSANSKKQQLDATMRYRATKKRAEEGQKLQENLLNSGTEGSSTLWSLGYRVYTKTREWYLDESLRGEGISSQGFGINFGHFLEAYYHLGGNKLNRSDNLPSASEFLTTILSLQNSQKFYQGGDFDNIQLKANTATLTNLKAITAALRSIKIELNRKNMQYEANLKKVFTPKKQEIASSVKASKRPQEALDDLLRYIMQES